MFESSNVICKTFFPPNVPVIGKKFYSKSCSFKEN